MMTVSGSSVYVMAPNLLSRAALKALFEHQLGFNVAVDTGYQATDVWYALRTPFDVAIVDCDTPEQEYLSVVEMIPRLKPQAKVILLTGTLDSAVFANWRGGFLDGAVSKHSGLADIEKAISWAKEGKRFFSEELQAAFTQTATSTPLSRLSRREAELLPLLARGLRLQDAATEMQISYKTADSYRTSLLRKLGCRDRVELARFAIREKIITP